MKKSSGSDNDAHNSPGSENTGCGDIEYCVSIAEKNTTGGASSRRRTPSCGLKPLTPENLERRRILSADDRSVVWEIELALTDIGLKVKHKNIAVFSVGIRKRMVLVTNGFANVDTHAHVR